MSAQYMNIVIDNKVVFPIKVYINSNNILKSDYTEDNNIVINNDLFQLYKPSYKLIISNKDLFKLYKFISNDINYIFQDLFVQENLDKLLKLKTTNNSNQNSFQTALDYTSLNYIILDDLATIPNLNFDKVYRFSKTGFLININNKSWNLLFIVNDYTKLENIKLRKDDLSAKTRQKFDFQILKSQTEIVPKVLIEDDELNFEEPVDTKPEFKRSYNNLVFIADDDDVNIIIMDKSSRHRS